jgi:hypothetical protein
MEKLREMEVARQEMKRKAFESHCLSTDFVFSLAFWEGKYSHPATQMAWEMWQAGQEQVLRVIYQSKVICAIEGAVQDQVEASGIKAELHRLDGEKIVDAIAENIHFPKLSETHVLVPKKPTQDMMVNALAVIATGISQRSIDEEIHMLWEKMLEAANQ